MMLNSTIHNNNIIILHIPSIQQSAFTFIKPTHNIVVSK